MGLGADKKRKYHNKTIHGNKKEAQAYLNKVLRERDMGIFSEPSKELFSTYLERWLEIAVKPRVMKRTYEDYRDLVRRYIDPKLGDTKLSQLTPLQIQSFYNDMTAKGLSPRTVRYTHSVLRNALDQAVKWKMLHQNPAQYVDLPRQKKTEMKALSPEQAQRFLEEAVDSRWYAFFSLLLTTGMRPGEALGLKWDDVDYKQGRVSIKRAMTRGGQLEEPKTAKSRRSIPIPKSVVQDLRNHKKTQAEERLQVKDYNDQGLIFASENGGSPHYSNLVNRHFKPLLKKAGLPETIRLYDLRHTCATLLLSAGENPKIVSERLGHANITLTLDTYSHVLPDMQKAATNKLEEMLFNGNYKK